MLSDGELTWTGPKIPAFMLLGLQRSFEAAAREKDSEFLAELWWTEEFGYTWYFPEQRAGHAWVQSRHEAWLEMPFSGAVKAGEFHSHGRIPPFFSGTDDNDELMIPGLYGVFGGYGMQDAEWRFRAVHEGVSFDVSRECMIGVLDTAAEPCLEETLSRQLLTSDRLRRLRYSLEEDVPDRTFRSLSNGDIRVLRMPAYEAWWWGRFPAFHAVSAAGGEISAAEMLTSSAYLMKAEDAGRELGKWKGDVEESITDFFFS